jgi:hypothetical protein
MDEKLPHFVVGKSANLLRQDERIGVKPLKVRPAMSLCSDAKNGSTV